MIVNLIFVIISILLAIGFKTGVADWLLIYYGCAPDNKKDKMNGKLILDVASISMIAVACTLLISIYLEYNWFFKLGLLFELIALVIFIGMIAYTFYLAQIKPNKNER